MGRNPVPMDDHVQCTTTFTGVCVVAVETFNAASVEPFLMST